MSTEKPKRKIKSAKLMVLKPEFRSRVVRDRSKYTRKDKQESSDGE